jgi:hypothetical protein
MSKSTRNTSLTLRIVEVVVLLNLTAIIVFKKVIPLAMDPMGMSA